ncbi:hypothetical protein [Mycobacterium aquaticum]|nr:hypothetical protein [Mycobacterium aquaticum]
MTVTRIDWHWMDGWPPGYNTVQVNLPPATLGAQTALQGQVGGGANYTGIMHYRRRLKDGSDKDIDFGAWPNWPPVIFDHISSITFATATGEDQEAFLVARMDYWG